MYGNRKLLAAYYVSDNKVSFDEIRKYLSDKLPEFMIPEKMIQVEEIPLNPNGKVDRKKIVGYNTNGLCINSIRCSAQ